MRSRKGAAKKRAAGESAHKGVYARSALVRYLSAMSEATICPTCKGRSAAYPENRAHPFCSKRCKLADLSNWFQERYAVAAEPAPDESNDDRLLH